MSVVPRCVRPKKKLNSDNYDAAIDKALKELRPNKTKKSAQDYILLLHEAFLKAQEPDHRALNKVLDDPELAQRKQTYQLLNTLDQRQEKIRPILPLMNPENGREIVFPFEDYSTQRQAVSNQLASLILNQAEDILGKNLSYYWYRENYKELQYLEQIRPLDQNTQTLARQVYEKGVGYGYGRLINQSDQVLPKAVATALLRVGPSENIGPWFRYHPQPQEERKYHFEVQMTINEIGLSPETLREQIITREKQVKDGTQPLRDSNNRIVLDSLGEVIEVDCFKKVTATIYKKQQHKAAYEQMELKVVNLQSGFTVTTIPLETTWVFDHYFADYKGEKDLIEEDLWALIEERQRPFPSDTQMLLDAFGELRLDIHQALRKLEL